MASILVILYLVFLSQYTAAQPNLTNDPDNVYFHPKSTKIVLKYDKGSNRLLTGDSTIMGETAISTPDVTLLTNAVLSDNLPFSKHDNPSTEETATSARNEKSSTNDDPTYTPNNIPIIDASSSSSKTTEMVPTQSNRAENTDSAFPQDDVESIDVSATAPLTIVSSTTMAPTVSSTTVPSTTKPSTTESPTTVSSTIAPTTVASTTVASTTKSSTTESPTTVSSTTVPTTVSSTTVSSTTEPSTTSSPTTTTQSNGYVIKLPFSFARIPVIPQVSSGITRLSSNFVSYHTVDIGEVGKSAVDRVNSVVGIIPKPQDFIPKVRMLYPKVPVPVVIPADPLHLRSLPSVMASSISGVSHGIADGISDVSNGIADGISGISNGVAYSISEVGNDITDRMADISDMVSKMQARLLPPAELEPPVITKIATPLTSISNNVVWDDATKSVDIVDNNDPAVLQYTPSTGLIIKVPLNAKSVTLINPIKSTKGDYILAIDNSIVLSKNLFEHKGVTEFKQFISFENKKAAFTKGKVDSKGRLWIGRSNENKGDIFVIEATGGNVILANYQKPGGMAWAKDNKKFFIVDTGKGVILSYDFDSQFGLIKNERILFDLKSHPDCIGELQDVAIDDKNNLWTTLNGSGMILHVDSITGDILRTISIPSKTVSALTFGGSYLNTLYVSSSEDNNSNSSIIYSIDNLGVSGVPTYSFNL